MPSRYPAPSEQHVETFLSGIVPAPTHVARMQSPQPEREPTGLIAEYVNESDELAAIAFADHDAVNFVGAAQAAVEAATVQEINGSAQLHDAAVDGFRNVADGLAAHLNSDYTPTLRLAHVHHLPGELSDEIKQLWRAPRGKRGYRVTVDDYGSGTVILYLN